ncbi:hypothetical protein FNW25_15970 [Flavobacterium franklandianum]|uniref:Uncharacterized protein n=1 Tax=Flavobacterium franklandianum TaxID=2594430 RepID=A0A553CQW4_9FLAO|nr:hypothetical protein [Flavobacterium franklandianum]TRX21407.1 hypothetical protein FNW25_15970 [Flavobacterium franklandianum]TRX22867.1 hypothetical protein FNW17_03630 [Flavobacterium franklandianum]
MALFFLFNFILDGLKSVPTKYVEPMALEDKYYKSSVGTTHFVVTDFNPLKWNIKLSPYKMCRAYGS